jgi:hypothetical protein
MQGMRVWSLPVHYSLTVDDLVASQKLVGRSVGRSVGDPREARNSGKRPVPTRPGTRLKSESPHFPRFEAEVVDAPGEQPPPRSL